MSYRHSLSNSRWSPRLIVAIASHSASHSDPTQGHCAAVASGLAYPTADPAAAPRLEHDIDSPCLYFAANPPDIDVTASLLSSLVVRGCPSFARRSRDNASPRYQNPPASHRIASHRRAAVWLPPRPPWRLQGKGRHCAAHLEWRCVPRTSTLTAFLRPHGLSYLHQPSPSTCPAW
jgi:hypothetical protein